MWVSLCRVQVNMHKIHRKQYSSRFPSLNTTYGKQVQYYRKHYGKVFQETVLHIFFYIMLQSISNIWPRHTAHPSLFRVSDRPRSMIDTPLFFLSLCIRLSVCLYISLYGLNHNGFPRWRVLYIPHMSRSRSIFFPEICIFLKGTVPQDFLDRFLRFQGRMCLLHIKIWKTLSAVFLFYFW